MSDNEEENNRVIAERDEKIADLEWSLAFVLALFGTYGAFNYAVSRFENALIIFLTVGITFIVLLGITSSLRKYLSILITTLMLLSTIFVIYKIFIWFNS